MPTRYWQGLVNGSSASGGTTEIYAPKFQKRDRKVESQAPCSKISTNDRSSHEQQF
jgi:hypothetical protein